MVDVRNLDLAELSEETVHYLKSCENLCRIHTRCFWSSFESEILMYVRSDMDIDYSYIPFNPFGMWEYYRDACELDGMKDSARAMCNLLVDSLEYCHTLEKTEHLYLSLGFREPTELCGKRDKELFDKDSEQGPDNRYIFMVSTMLNDFLQTKDKERFLKLSEYFYSDILYAIGKFLFDITGLRVVVELDKRNILEVATIMDIQHGFVCGLCPEEDRKTETSFFS